MAVNEGGPHLPLLHDQSAQMGADLPPLFHEILPPEAPFFSSSRMHCTVFI